MAVEAGNRSAVKYFIQTNKSKKSGRAKRDSTINIASVSGTNARILLLIVFTPYVLLVLWELHFQKEIPQ